MDIFNSELQEDAYRIHQVLENLEFLDILKFLRTKVPLAETENRCQLALQHFFELENSYATQRENYEEELQADFLCIRHLVNSVSDKDIQDLLKLLGPVPNRKYIAARILIGSDVQPYGQKRKCDNICNSESEPSSSKQFKLGAPDKTSQINGNDILKPDLKYGTSEFEESLDRPAENRENQEEYEQFTEPHTSTDIPTSEHSASEDLPKEITEQEEPLKLIINRAKDRKENNIFAPITSAIIENNQTQIRSENNGAPENIEVPERKSDVQQPQLAAASTHISEQPATIPERFTFKDICSHWPLVEPGPSTSQYHQREENELPDPQQILPPLVPILPVAQQIEPAPIATAFGLVDLTQKTPEVPKITDEKLVLKLIEVFPDASPDYIRDICAGKEWNMQNFDELVTVILSDEYPKRPERQPSPPNEVDPEEQFIMLKELLPDADPSYLHEKLDQLAGDQDGLRQFIEDAMENKNYPTLKEYLRKQQISAQQRQYTTEFNVERFVELFPDPASVFEDPNRKSTILNHSDRSYVNWAMRCKYRQLYAKDIRIVIEIEGTKNIFSIIQKLDALVVKGCFKKSKMGTSPRPDTQNIPLLQELAYFEHKEEIYNHIENKKKQEARLRQNAKELGLLHTCSCCYDEEIMPDDIFTCTGGCRFCRDCVKRGTEVAFGDGKVDFPCLMACGAEFSLQVLQSVLSPKVFSKLAQKKALAEVKAAGVEDLESCPFCDFATIPAPTDRIFRCLNQECMKESCRLCKEPSHVPLRCDEVEKDEAVKARTYIEDKMTEALIRQCWKCNAKFIKLEGCNKMTCSCGAVMCYVCRQPVKDYRHFNGQGGDRHDLCPLYTDNFSVNEKNVMEAAEEAKKTVDPTVLKNDPTADLQKHFGQPAKDAKLRANQIAQRRREIEQMREMRLNIAVLREDARILGRALNRPVHRHVHGHRPVVVQGPAPHQRANQLLNYQVRVPATMNNIRRVEQRVNVELGPPMENANRAGNPLPHPPPPNSPPPVHIPPDLFDLMQVFDNNLT